MRWQIASQRRAWAEFRAHVGQQARRRRRPQGNRLLEIHGLVGGIGEQAGLCWTAEQDAQRLAQTARDRTEEHHRLVLRAVAEIGGHFLLGAAHSLGNLGLRVSLVNGQALAVANGARPRAKGFPPGASDRDSWLTLRDAAPLLNRAAAATTNRHLERIAEAINGLSSDGRFVAIDERRGMDYHRRRPQSVPHASPRSGTYETQPGMVRISMVAAGLDPEADAPAVHGLLVAAMQPVLLTMRQLRNEVPKALRAEGLTYHEHL